MWEQIRSNQTRSIVLVVVMGAILLLLGYFLGLYFLDSGEIGLLMALLIWIIMSLIGYFQGDSILLNMSNARKIGPDDYPRLYNVVEEMRLASGLEEMPSVYIIDDPALNAFATGRDPKKASVAVTSGLLQKLNRDELQGVVGHEISHIGNRDVLLMAMCSVLLGTIVMLSWYASRFMLFGGMGKSRRSSSSGGGGAQIIIIIVAIVLMILAPILAQFIYLAISRKREYLADASAALYTRYPEGLASALEKLAASTSQIKSANNATAPMYIVNPFRKQGMVASDLTSTHPPISERIRILRAMSGASIKDYDQAFKQVRNTSGVIPGSSLKSAGVFAIRAASAEPEQKEVDTTQAEVQRARDTSNVLWKLNNYKIHDCECGTRFKIPPDYQHTQFICPHCGRLNNIIG